MPSGVRGFVLTLSSSLGWTLPFTIGVKREWHRGEIKRTCAGCPGSPQVSVGRSLLLTLQRQEAGLEMEPDSSSGRHWDLTFLVDLRHNIGMKVQGYSNDILTVQCCYTAFLLTKKSQSFSSHIPWRKTYGCIWEQTTCHEHLVSPSIMSPGISQLPLQVRLASRNWYQPIELKSKFKLRLFCLSLLLQAWKPLLRWQCAKCCNSES